MKIKYLLTYSLVVLFFMSCSKNSSNDRENDDAAIYYIVVDNMGDAVVSFSFQTSIEPLQTVSVKANSNDRIRVRARIGEYVKFSTELTNGTFTVVDSKDVLLTGFPPSSNSRTQDYYFLAFDPNDAIKDPMTFKKGLVKNVAELGLNKRFLLQKWYYLQNGIETSVPFPLGCNADDEYVITLDDFRYRNLDPDLFVCSVEIAKGADNCGGWPESAPQRSIHPTIFSNNSSTVSFPVYDPSSIEYPSGHYYADLIFDSVGNANKTLTFHRNSSNGAKEVFVYKQKN